MRIRISYLLAILEIVALANITYGQWEKIAMPGSKSGAVYTICFTDGKMFAGIKGGVFVSSDDGEHWKKVNPDLPPRANNASVFSLAVSGEKLFAAFNEPGVFITSDVGETWIQAEIDAGLRNTPQVLAASGDWIIGMNYYFNGFQSTDNGISWNPISNLKITAAAVQDSVALALTINNGIFRSTDFGTSWNKVHNTHSTGFSSKSSIVFSENKVFCGVGRYLTGSYVLISTDHGLTWESDSSFINCNSINSLVVSPEESDNGFIFAATDSGVFRSSDDGLNWVNMSNGLNSNLIFSLAFKPDEFFGNHVLYAATGNGIFKSSDYGESWTVVRSPSNWILTSGGSEIFAVTSNSSYRGRYLFTMVTENINHTTLCRSTDNGLTWIKMFEDYLENNAQVLSLVANTNGSNNFTLFAKGNWYNVIPGSPTGIILRYNSSGQVWEDLNFEPNSQISNVSAGPSGIFVTTISQVPGTENAIFRSTDNGDTWLNVFSAEFSVSTFSFSGVKIFAGGVQHIRTPIIKFINSIIVSGDNGSNWYAVPSPLDSGTVYGNDLLDTNSVLSSLCASGPHLLAGMRAYYFYESLYSTQYAYGGILYHLVREGNNWKIADSSFIGSSVFALVPSGDYIFAATDTGIFISNDYGTTWDDVSSGMRNIYTFSLFISGNYIYANTINGIWKRSISEITSVENEPPIKIIPKHYTLEQNYPNPFNPATKIQYSIPKSGYISLKVLNLLGQEVATIFEGYKQAGNYQAIFDGSGFASGIYLYRIQAGNYVETKKLVLLK